ncbi:MAG: hypothetical protein ACPK85_09730 [Methanosarcina sp.]
MSIKNQNKFLRKRPLFIIILFICTILLFIFIESPAPIFQIFNDDIKNHEVTVEIFNQDNELVINKIYNLDPGADFLEKRSLSLRLPQSKDEYILKITIDKKITNTTRIEISDQYTGISIRLYSKNYETGENIPILIEINEKL